VILLDIVTRIVAFNNSSICTDFQIILTSDVIIQLNARSFYILTSEISLNFAYNLHKIETVCFSETRLKVRFEPVLSVITFYQTKQIMTSLI